MGKKAWVKPVTVVQKFEANEPCAAEPCWEVLCESNGYYDYWKGTTATSNAPTPGQWDGNEDYFGLGGLINNNRGHNSCKDAGHTLFSFDVDNETVTFLGESDGSDNGKVTSWVDNGDGKLGIGDQVYWVTYEERSPGLKDFTWTHWGKISKTANRS